MKTTKLLSKVLSVAFAIILSLQSIGQQAEFTQKLEKSPVFDISKSGELLFDQMYNPGAGYIVSQRFSDIGSNTNTCAAADDFDVPAGENWDVYSIGIFGAYWTGNAGGGDTLNIFILNNDNGLPGDTLYEFINHTDFYTEEELVNDNIFTYFEIFLPSAISLSEGGYWLSVQMVADFNTIGQWGWRDHVYETTIYGEEWHWINPKDGFGTGATTWTPANVVVGPWLLWELSFGLFGEPVENDLSLLSINSPVEIYNEPQIEDVPVTVTIKNEGSNPQTGFDMKYVFEGNEVIENIGSVVLQPNEVYEFTFSQGLDLSSPGAYDLTVSTMLSGDENPENDEQSLNIIVYDPTVYTMPSFTTSSITTCSGTFADAGGLEGNLIDDDWGILTIYPAIAGAKTRLEFIQFDIGWSEFWIYDGEDINAPSLGFWESNISPGTITATYPNTSGALTIHFIAQTWTPFEKPGWAANISCYEPVEDDFAVLNLELSNPAINAGEFVTATATIQNIGTIIQSKDITFSANGETFATVATGDVSQSDIITIEAIWNPSEANNYTVTASVPDDQGIDNNNTFSIQQEVFVTGYFYEGFELLQFPPDGWTQTDNIWTRYDEVPAEGDGYAWFYGDYGYHDTLITPRLIINEDATIEFYAYSSAWWPGELDLCWMNAETGEWQLIEEINLSWFGYTIFQIDVSAAAGNNYLGFVGKYNPLGGLGELRIDEVIGIEGISEFYHDYDLKAYQVSGSIIPEMNISESYVVDFKNMGSQAVAGSAYSFKLMQEPNIELTSVDGIDLLPYQPGSVGFDYTFPQSGLKNIYVEIDFSEDENFDNNLSNILPVYVQQEGTMIVNVGEEENYFQNSWHPVHLGLRTISQTLYLAEDIGEPNTITGIMYYYQYMMDYPVFDIPLELWFTETTAINMADSMVSVVDSALVFDGTFDLYPGQNGVYIPLNFPFSYEGGNLMVTAFKDDTEYYGHNFWQYSNSDEIMVRYFGGFNEIDPYNLPVLWHIWKTEYANISFFKYDLTGQYCIPQTLNGTNNGDYIDGVTFNEIENLSTGSQGGPAYNNYSNLSTNVERSRYYDLTIQAETSGIKGSIAAWIDFNVDGDMDDEGERVVHISNYDASQEITVPILIPEDAVPSLTIMRVRNSADSVLFSSCETVDYGETEDYGINIIETVQVYNPVIDFTSPIDYDGNVDLNWNVPDNPGSAIIEGFELSNWPPQNGWEVKVSTTLDGTLTNPTDVTWAQYNENMEYVYNGAFATLCTADAPDFNWLISPSVQMFGNDDLNFMLNYSSDASGYSKFYVRAEVDDVWTTILEYTDEITFYNNYDELVTVDLSQFAGKTVRLAFVSQYNDAYPIALDDIVIKGVATDYSGIENLSGYEIYRNGELLSEITDPSVVSFSEQVSITENYEYCLIAIYEVGQSEEVCSSVFYFAPLTPPVNVLANAVDNDVTVNWTAPNEGVIRFADDFEDYNVGEQVACQNPDNWTTWSLEPCGASDPYITSEMTYSGENSVVIEGVADLMHLRDELIEGGKYSVNFKLLIPEGYNGYFNVIQDHDLQIGSLWGFQAFFAENGYGEVDAGGYGAATFTYEYDQWMYMEVIVDMDTDWGQFYIDEELIHEWQWSTGISGTFGWNTLEAVDFYAWNNRVTLPKFYIDDFQLIQLYESDDFLSYNVFRDAELVGNTNATQFDDADVLSGLHTYCVSALYDEGESTQVCDWVSILGTPENFSAEVININDVYCTWDEVISDELLGYEVYRDDEQVSNLVTDLEWTDVDVEGGTHTYHVIAVFENGESEPSNSSTVIILIAPTNLVANPVSEDIVLEWESVGTVTELIKLYQHDYTPVNGHYQFFNYGYGVIFDLSAYPDATVETVDFHHASWGIPGIWSYKFHIFDWNTLTEIAEVGPFQTTGDDTWEYEIPLGSIASGTNQLGVFLEPLGNTPDDAYPVLSADAVLEGYSVIVDLDDLYAQTPSVGDFILDLWILSEGKGETVQANKVNLSNAMNTWARNPFTPVEGEYEVNQTDMGGKFLSGYNVYYAYDPDQFEFLDFTIDTIYTHEGMGIIPGLHKYYVTSIYDEGESEPSNEATVLISSIEGNMAEDINVYPNPFKDVVVVNSDRNISNVIVVNSQGQVVYEKRGINSMEYRIDLNGQLAGIYQIRIKTETGWINRKMIKK